MYPQRSPRPQRQDSKRLRFGLGTYRKKICRFCENSVEYIDYKDDRMLRRFVNDRGKIIPRRISGNCAKHQREVTQAIKRCRQMGLVPYQAEAFD